MVANPYSEQQRIEAMQAATIAAVRTHFSHLAVRDIITPPHEWFDAALARQIATHILVAEFGLPKRRISTMQGRGRTQILMAVRTVEARLEDDVFRRAYDRMAVGAHNFFMQELQKATA